MRKKSFENLQYNEAVTFKVAGRGNHLVDSYQSRKGTPVIDGSCACVKCFFCPTVAEQRVGHLVVGIQALVVDVGR